MESTARDEAVAAVMELSHAVEVLRRKGIIRSNRLICELGEWYVCQLYGGERAPSPTKKGWNVCLSPGKERLQVRTQSCELEDKWDYLDSIPTGFDRLVVVILTDSLTISAIYDVPAEELGSVLRMGDENRPKYSWDDLEPWRVNPAKLPGYKNVAPLVAQDAWTKGGTE